MKDDGISRLLAPRWGQGPENAPLSLPTGSRRPWLGSSNRD